MILERIEGPWDVKKLNQEELKTLAAEIRQFLIGKISVTGGRSGVHPSLLYPKIPEKRRIPGDHKDCLLLLFRYGWEALLLLQ